MDVKHLLAAAGIVAIGTLTIVAPASADDGPGHGRGHGKLEFEDFVGVSDAQTGAKGAVRGVNGGLLPWGIGDAEVEIHGAKVEVAFEDLVFTSGPNTGRNTVGSMAVVLTCMGTDGNATRAVSAPFPVTVASATDPGGDADVTTTIAAPMPCADPVALITNAPGTAWFAASPVD